MQIHVEFFGPIARGEWSPKEDFTRTGPIELGEFLVSIGFLSEHLSHIIIVRNGSITKDMETVLSDGDRLTLSVLLGGG